eukprot:299040_1
MDKIFGGKRKTAKEISRESKRNLAREGRSIERERKKLEREEQKITKEIKREMGLGHTGAAKTLAKSLVDVRKQQDKMREMQAHTRSLGIQVTTMAASSNMAKSMG